MHDPQAMRAIERAGHLPEPLYDQRRRLRDVPRVLLEITSVEELHHDVWQVPELAHHVRIGDADHVVTADLRRRAGLALEAVDRLARRVGSRNEDFQREALAGMDVLDFVDDTHASAADFANRAVAPPPQGRELGCHRVLLTRKVLSVNDTAGFPYFIDGKAHAVSCEHLSFEESVSFEDSVRDDHRA